MEIYIPVRMLPLGRAVPPRLRLMTTCGILYWEKQLNFLFLFHFSFFLCGSMLPEKKKGEKMPSSLPSLCERTEIPGVLDRHSGCRPGLHLDKSLTRLRDLTEWSNLHVEAELYCHNVSSI